MTAVSPARWKDLTFTQSGIKDNTLDDNLLDTRPSSENPIRQEPMARAGALDVLPLELLHEVLAQLDLRSLTYFRLVSRRASGLVDSLPEYSDIAKHASNALRGILAIGTGPYINCTTLHGSLCTARCEQCGDFGGYLYLLTCKRVCFLCLSKTEVFLPLAPSHACRKFGLDRHHIESLPRMMVVPGTYSPNRKKIASSATLVDYEHARLAGINLHGSLGAMEEYVSQAQARGLEAYRTRLAEQKSDSGNRRPRRPPALDPVDGKSGNPHRFAAIARVPWLDRASRRVEHGLYCVGCERSSHRPCHWRILFSPVSFKEHLAKCGEIRGGKHCPL